MITLYDAVDDITVELPNDLEWVDEFDWNPVAQAIDYTLTGTLLIDEGTRQAGRFITLEGKEDMGWVTRQVVIALQGRRDISGREFTLTLPDARSFQVMFRQSDTPVQAAAVLPWKQSANEDWYTLSLKFMEI